MCRGSRTSGSEDGPRKRRRLNGQHRASVRSDHTWATLAHLAGVDVRIVSERLGHARAKITCDIYQHVTTMQADAAETVARLIFGTPGQPPG